MTELLGKCSVCGKDAGVVYPLLPGSPAFCSAHHTPQSAGPFGCDFSGPDDFDIPFDGDDVPFHIGLLGYQKLDRKVFVWTDREGVRHKLKDIGDVYLTNIIGYLERGGGHVMCRSVVRRKEVIDFLRTEATTRGLEVFSG